jgi:hypothetical protein
VFTKQGKRRVEHALADGGGDGLGLITGGGGEGERRLVFLISDIFTCVRYDIVPICL